MRELSVAEQRYQAVLAVIKDGRTVTETAAAVGVSRQSLHTWLARYEAAGLEGLVDRSHRPSGHPAHGRLAEWPLAPHRWRARTSTRRLRTDSGPCRQIRASRARRRPAR